MKKDLNWGIMGCGGIAEKFASSMQVANGGQVLAGASKTKGKASDFCDRNSIPLSYQSYEEMVSNEELDCIYVATTHNFHHQGVLMALEAGKHVLCEKPLGVNAKEVSEMIESAKRNNCFLMEAMWTRFLPAVRKLKALLEEEAIGEICSVHASFGARMQPPPESRLLNPKLAGGALLDLGIYPLSIISMIMNQSQPLKMESMVRMASTGVDEEASMHFQFPDESMAHAFVSLKSELENDCLVTGTKGKLKIDPWFFNARKVSLYKNELTQSWDFPHKDKQSFKYEIEAVHDALNKGWKEHPIMPLNETLQLAKWMDHFRFQWGFKYPFE